jgi:hypothetical protein
LAWGERFLRVSETYGTKETVAVVVVNRVSFGRTEVGGGTGVDILSILSTAIKVELPDLLVPTVWLGKKIACSALPNLELANNLSL